MRERYSRLFLLPRDLHTEGSPVLIAAGALLKDRQSGNVLVQLKFRNISDKPVQSVKIRVNAFDTAGEALRGAEAFSYLDLSAAPGSEFGQKTPVYLPDATTRSYSVEILSVVHSDGEVFTPCGARTLHAASGEARERLQRIRQEETAAEAAMAAADAEWIRRMKWLSFIPLGLLVLLLGVKMAASNAPLSYIRWILLTSVPELILPGICGALPFLYGRKRKACKILTYITLALSVPGLLFRLYDLIRYIGPLFASGAWLSLLWCLMDVVLEAAVAALAVCFILKIKRPST